MAEQTRTRHRTHATGAARRHTRRQPFDRRELERQGWRTTLEYRENHQRDASGMLGAVVTEWRAEGEYVTAEGEIASVSASGSSPAAAWRRLRIVADSELDRRPPASVRSVASR